MLTIINMSGVYRDQEWFREELLPDLLCMHGTAGRNMPEGPTASLRPGRDKGSECRIPQIRFLDMEGLRGTNGYCDDEAAARIRERLDAYGLRNHAGAAAMDNAPDIHLIDNGNYHYLTYFFAETVNEPFELVVFDHHTDMQRPGFGDILSCGGWIRDLILSDHAPCRITVVGADKDLIREAISGDDDIAAAVDKGTVIFTDRYTSMYVADAATGDAAAAAHEDHMAAGIAGTDEMILPVYISIDLDVLSVSELTVNWDQGSMTRAELMHELSAVISTGKVIGIDICGAPASGQETEGWQSILMDLVRLSTKIT